MPLIGTENGYLCIQDASPVTTGAVAGNFATVAIQCLDKLSYDKVRPDQSICLTTYDLSFCHLHQRFVIAGVNFFSRETTRWPSTVTTTPLTTSLTVDTVSHIRLHDSDSPGFTSGNAVTLTLDVHTIQS